MNIDLSELPESVRDKFANLPPFTEEKRNILREAAERLKRDPSFQADVLKSEFVSAMMEAMHSLKMTQSSLAEKWGRTRQYISKLFNEDKRVNFTIDTMVECAMTLNRRVELNFPPIDEAVDETKSPVSDAYSILPFESANVLLFSQQPTTPSNIIPFDGEYAAAS